MGVHRTCGEPDEIKKKIHTRKTLPLLFEIRRAQDDRPRRVVQAVRPADRHAHGQRRRQRTPRRRVRQHASSPLHNKDGFPFFGCGGFSLVSSGSPRVLRAHMRRTCGEPRKVELTVTHGLLDWMALTGTWATLRTRNRAAKLKGSGAGNVLDSVRASTRRVYSLLGEGPHGCAAHRTRNDGRSWINTRLQVRRLALERRGVSMELGPRLLAGGGERLGGILAKRSPIAP